MNSKRAVRSVAFRRCELYRAGHLNSQPLNNASNLTLKKRKSHHGTSAGHDKWD
ncbi:MAG: hypothetical protein ACFE9C_14225 [Candidatus Hodarchaeota archaeon]